MILYHGSNVEVKDPKILTSEKSLTTLRFLESYEVQ